MHPSQTFDLQCSLAIIRGKAKHPIEYLKCL
jgi:hypothetical protein